MNKNEMTGHVVNCMKSIEYNLICIIHNFFLPSNVVFFDNVLLNSDIISFDMKVKVVKKIFMYRNIKYDFGNLHRLMTILDLFVKGSSFTDLSEGDSQFIEELKSDDVYDTHKVERLYKKFIELYKEEDNNIAKLAEKLSK